jgi:hypothetical protein
LIESIEILAFLSILSSRPLLTGKKIVGLAKKATPASAVIAIGKHQIVALPASRSDRLWNKQPIRDCSSLKAPIAK